MPANRLAGEKSPYLLQHAHNPVDWYPWGPEAFAKARLEDKPVFLSVGYSTCHWCHVMERESFEDEGIAARLNRDFVPIKVDREERPDVDRIYMTFVQATIGSGGWPMSVWLTPQLEPFFGGTYFPPETRMGQPGFASILDQIAAAWRSDRAAIAASAREVLEQLRSHAEVAPAHPGAPAIDTALLDSGFFAFRHAFDRSTGGFGGAPKFPRPAVFEFLLRYHARTRNQKALDMVLVTLRQMAQGGMRDQLGGGFHRYSVDDRWFVPHFEKMLYDQAQLAVSYLEAFQITGEPGFAETARATLDYVLRDMTAPEGGFYSAEDADSAADATHPDVKSEGAFYLWTAGEIRSLAGDPAGEWFRRRFGVDAGGNVAHDPHDEFGGRNILYQARTVEETALAAARDPAEVRAALDAAMGVLLEARSRRPRPHLDSKILAGWNGLMISAFALGGAVLDEPAYAEAARRAADFLCTHLYDAGTGSLLRRFREGEAAIPGFLDDYAMAAQGLLDLYAAQFDFGRLETAVRLAERMLELFEDRDGGGFFATAAGDPSLVMRVKDDYDGAEPAGNSVAALALLRLAALTGRDEFRSSAERALAAFVPRVAGAPPALPAMLAACEFYMAAPRQIVLVGAREAADTRALARVLAGRFLPDTVALLVNSEQTRAALAAHSPAIAFMHSIDGRASAYVCRDFACQLPVTEAAALAELLQ